MEALVLLGMFAIVIGIIMLIVNAIRRRRLQTGGIVIVVGLAALIIGASLPESTEQSPESTQAPASTTSPSPAPEPQETPMITTHPLESAPTAILTSTTVPSGTLSPPLDQTQTSNIRDYIEPTNSLVRDTAISVVQKAPQGVFSNSDEWKIWQINYWVANNISYVSDPKGQEYFAYANETLETKGGDCDDIAILMASMYESIGLDSAIANIDTDDNGKSDHMTCLVYYSKDSASFIDEEKTIMNAAGIASPTGKIWLKYIDAVTSKLLSKYSIGIWIIADPPMAEVKDMVGYITHKPYNLKSVIDVGN